MSTSTDFLKLTLPADEDSADIQVLNNNFIDIDNYSNYNQQVANGVYKGRNIEEIPELAEEITAAGNVYNFLHNRASSANWNHLRVGDYINVPQGDYGVRKWQIAHFDPWYNFGNPAMSHHIVFVDANHVKLPSTDFYKTNTDHIMWNTTNTNNGNIASACPYLVSNLHNWELINFLPSFPDQLKVYMLERSEYLEQRYSETSKLSTSTGGTWKPIGKVWSLSEIEIYGNTCWSNSQWSVGTGRQLDYFKNISNQIDASRKPFWLRTPADNSDTNVCFMTDWGRPGSEAATNNNIYPRCVFLLG